MNLLASVLLTVAGLVNFLSGFLALFPGLFELALTPAPDGPADSSASVGELLGTTYGALAMGLLGIGIAQAGLGPWLSVLLRVGPPLAYLVVLLALAGIGIEVWGALLKSAFSAVNAFGTAVSLLVLALGLLSAGGRRTG